MGSKYFFNLEKIHPFSESTAGSLKWVTSKEVPGLVNISFSILKLNPRGSQEPIWHPNAHKIGYCTQGKALVSIRTPTNFEVFSVQAGDVFFIPQGYIHHFENIGPQEVVINFACNVTIPQVMCLSKAMQSLSDPVCEATFATPPGFMDGLKKSRSEELLKTLTTKAPTLDFNASRFEFNIRGSHKPVTTKGGYLQLATKKCLPILEGLGILGFGLNPKGVVEPHWHTNAGELVYILKGEARITILAPDGHVEILEVNGGQGAFAPASYFHNIENIGDEKVEVIAFFNHAEPDYIGIGEVVGAYDPTLLGSIFNVEPNYFDALRKTTDPLVIVPV